MLCHVLSLGANADVPAKSVPGLHDYFRFAGIDGLETFSTLAGGGSLSISKVIASQDGRVTFTERAFSDCSSVLEPLDGKVAFFGLAPNYEVVTRSEKDALGPASLARFLETHDFSANVLKCDLEGLDGSFCLSFLDNAPELDLVQMELRFEEFYKGELPLHEVVAKMRALGFEVIKCKTEDWKPAFGRGGASENAPPIGGVTAYADVIFARSSVLHLHETEDLPVDRATRFVLGLLWLGLYSVAARQLAYFDQHIPVETQTLLSERMWYFSRRRRRQRFIKRLLMPLVLVRRRFIAHNHFLRHVIME